MIITVRASLGDGEDVWIAFYPDMQFIHAQGDTPEQARQYLVEEVYPDALAYCQEHNFPLSPIRDYENGDYLIVDCQDMKASLLKSH